MKVDKRNPYHWLLLMQQGLYTLLASCTRYLWPRRGKPVVVLYGHQLSGNLKALYDEWNLTRRQNFECYFLSLDPRYSKDLRKDGIQVLQCCRLGDMLLVGRASAIITDHGLHAMRSFLTLTDIYFIDVWHGIPYKGFTSENFRVQHRYREIWVSSPVLKRIYEEQYGFSPAKVKDLGYARADKLFRDDPPKSDLRKALNIAETGKLVLYAPTWRQDDRRRELFPFGEDHKSFIQALDEVCRINSAILLIRSHLNARINQGEFTNVRYCSMKEFPDTESILQHTDVLICDWSSIAIDYLALSRPAIFLDVDPPFKNGFSLGPEYRYGDIATSMQTLTESLEHALSNPQGFLAGKKDLYLQVTEAAYGTNSGGKAASTQLEHLWQKINQTE